jgi:KaiC/GvpD/RAD55 family RecA-like ATPase
MDNYKLLTMSEIETTQVKFLTEPYLPSGRISLIIGDPGEGKTTLSLAIAAAVTTGTTLPWSDTPCEVGDILFQTAEDCYSDTIKPRLELLGADLTRVHFVDDTEYPLTLTDERLERAITDTNAKMLIIDPIQAFLGKADIHNANAMRPLMKHLGDVAERTDCAAVLIGHLNKNGSKSTYRALGSIDIYAAARSVLMVGKLPLDDTMRAFAHSKSNLSAPGKSQAFGFDPASGFCWLGDCDVTTDQLLDPKNASKSEQQPDSQLDGAMKFLMSELSGEPVLSTEIMQRAVAAGISEITLKRAKKAIGVKAQQLGGAWYCSLSEAHRNVSGSLQSDDTLD